MKPPVLIDEFDAMSAAGPAEAEHETPDGIKRSRSG